MHRFSECRLLCGAMSLLFALTAQAQGQPAGRNFHTADGGYWDDRFGVLGLNGPVHAIAGHENKIYVGGHFTKAGDTDANNIAMWDGARWQPLGAGVSNLTSAATVYAIAITPDGNVFVAGNFNRIGDSVAVGIAMWNGASWSQLVSSGQEGLNNTVYALAVLDNDVYACGLFSRAGNLTVNGMAKWDGAQWARLGTSSVNGVAGGVAYALCAHGNELYVGGDFNSAGSLSANGLAKWHPVRNEWSALDRGVEGAVYALAAKDSNEVFAGGDFTLASGVIARNIAKWNGNAWSSLGNGANNGVAEPVRALTFNQQHLFVGGDFREAGSGAANHVAKWDGSNWSALGSGVSGAVLSLAHNGNHVVYAGGQFQTTGDMPSYYFGIWQEQANAVADKRERWQGFALHQNFPNPFNPATAIRFTLVRPLWVSLKIYDGQGRETVTLHEGRLGAGEHVRYWNAQGFTSGVYFCRITAGASQETRKILLMR